MESTDVSAGIRDALARGDHAQALAAASHAVAERPDNAQAHRLLAVAQQAAGEHDQALASMDRAIALAPDDAQVHFERAGLLLGARELDAAQAALARSIGLDPNLFGAYVLQAQLALGRGDLDEADRLRRLAVRVVPEHPQLSAIEGMLALRRNEPARAQIILATALQRYPDDAQVAYALGFAYMAQGHLAFAEQVFRNVLARHPDARNLHALIADLLRQQGRPDEAVQELAPLLADPARATPGLRRIAGELELAAGRPERALPWLRDSLGAEPREPRTLAALMEAWRRLGDAGQARSTLDAALATSPEVVDLWQARLALEAPGSDATLAVVARWLTTTPDAIPALEARMALHDQAGESDAALALAERIVALEPGRSSAEFRLIEGLLAHNPAAAIARVEQLLAGAATPQGQRLLIGWLGLAQDRAGQSAAAVASWMRLHAETAANRLAPWQPGTTPDAWAAPAIAADAAPIALLWGPPGSAVERVAGVLAGTLPAFRSDRFGPSPPRDAFQRFDAIAELANGAMAPADVVRQWQDGLPARGIADGQIIDWLPYWDNLLLLGLRAHAPSGLLLIALRDPRDLLLDWLAYGAAVPPLAMRSPTEAAEWLARVLDQVADLHEQDLYPHSVLRLDAVLDDPQALAELVGTAIQTPLPPAAVTPPPRFAAGHWRAYADALAEPIAILTPVARRLGYE
ncbi:MAG: adenylate cyclase [Xanthomonadaceae bacterium]|nr:adenylate cyclase [Xanthomonadaceae bacterium]